MRQNLNEYGNGFDYAVNAASAFYPIKRISVAEGAEQYLRIEQPGGYSGSWSPSETPYMIEPMNMLASRRHEAVCFVGPSRTGKTMGLLDAWFAYAVTCDPGDMLIVQMSQDKARDYSKTRIDRAIRYSPEIKSYMSGSGHDDNTHDKLFKHGMWVKIGWPSATQLSSSDYRYVALTDYDRMPDNIDGEGAAFALGLKRTQTFLSRGMTMVESSPGRDLIDPNWRQITAHEAPPTNGILGIYNRSDRRRWYWPCPSCGEYYEAKPGLSLFSLLPAIDDLIEIVRKENLKKLADHSAKIACPNCGTLTDATEKYQMNQRGRWLAEGQYIENGEIVGDSSKSNIVGYWMGGVAAAYQHWNSLILRYLQGLREYVLTGAEESLKSTINTDQGMPYLPMHLLEQSDDLQKTSSISSVDRYFVPDETRLLIASVDIQNGKSGRFVVQVHAIGARLEQWVVDRFDITFNGNRRVDPGVYSEDWDLLLDRVITASYKTYDNQKILIHQVAIDSGGCGNTTDYAYQFYRKLRLLGHASKVMLIKGGSNDTKSPVVKSYAKDQNGKPMKDVPLYILNTNALKDKVDAMLRRQFGGGLCLHIPDWVDSDFYDELRAEVRDPKTGKWIKVRERNESLDLCVYIMAACWKLGLNNERFNWDNSPVWAQPLSTNSSVMSIEQAREARDTAKLTKPSMLAGFKRGA